MTLIVRYPTPKPGHMRDILRRELPDMEIRDWDEPGDRSEIQYAVVWEPPRGELKTFPNLNYIFSMGAGVDHLKGDPDLPEVPIVRLIDDALTQGMTEYVVQRVLHYHRRQPEFDEQQRGKLWKLLNVPPAWDRRVGLMGLGALGCDAARALIALKFNVTGWSRTPKIMAGVESFHGPEGLSPFLAKTEILVCLLPLTPATTGILNRNLLAKLPKRAFLINPGRGQSLVEEDILAALDSGQLAGASLDVFKTEPLSPKHPFWAHPKIAVTPHNASRTDTASAARTIAANIARINAGEMPEGLVDRDLGY